MVGAVKDAVDRLQQEMTQRFARLEELNDRSGFLPDTKQRLGTNNGDRSLRMNCTPLGSG